MEGTSPLHRWVIYALTFCLSGVIALWLTPRMRDAAIRFGIVDTPDGRLKRQAQPVPYLGGLAIYLAFLVALALTFEFSDQVLGMLLAGSIVVILGLLDDLGQLGPLIKICGQLVAIWVLIKSGIFIQLTFIPPEIAYPLTVIWLLATINAFNLLDIMDGLSTGTAILASLTFMVIADLDGGIASATMAAALAGACIGFLRFNRYPAQIYMGDTGSMFLGVVLAIVHGSAAAKQTMLSTTRPTRPSPCRPSCSGDCPPASRSRAHRCEVVKSTALVGNDRWIPGRSR